MILTRMRRTVALLMTATWVNVLAGFPAAADSRSDTFQPDVFGTGAALKDWRTLPGG